MALDDCIQWIISLVERGDANAVRLSVAEADAYLASFDDVRGAKTRRNESVAALRIELPRNWQGIPFFSPLFVPGFEWDIYGPRGLHQGLRRLTVAQRPAPFEGSVGFPV